MNASLFDNDLDNRLNDVSLPAGLLARLRMLPLADDADLDEVLADVVVPATLNQRLCRTPLSVPARRLSRWLEQAAAAVLIFAIGVAYIFAAVAFAAPRFEQRAWGDESQLALVSGMERLEPVVQQASSEEIPDELATPFIDLALAVGDERGTMRHVGTSIKHELPTSEPFAIAVGPRNATFGMAETAFDVLNSRSIEREAVTLADTGAIDFGFWRQTGILPWLETVSNRSIAVPLVCDDTSYRLARQEIRAGRLPVAADVRIEEFLAGIDYGLANQQVGAPSLVLAAGPSPFATPLDDLVVHSVRTRWLVMIAAVLPEHAEHATARSRPQLVVEFSAEHVAKYRILGYGPPVRDRGNNGEVNSDEQDHSALPGRSAVILCEIEVTGPDDAEAELARGRLEGVAEYGSSEAESSRNVAVLRPAMFSRDFNAAPLVWRQATLVALAAELLAGSPLAESASLTDVAALARQMEPLVYDQTGWRDFIEMVVRAQSLRSSLLRAF